MAEHIEREKLNQYLHETMSAQTTTAGIAYVRDLWNKVLSVPAADVAPVVHGQWVEYKRAHYFKCSECKETVPYRKAMLLNGERKYNFCPNCGAKMDGGKA